MNCLSAGSASTIPPSSNNEEIASKNDAETSG